MQSVNATQMLLAAQQGQSGAIERLFSAVYGELKAIANRQLYGNVLSHHVSPTELVHEAYLKLIDGSARSWRSRTHFFAVGSKVMRQLLVDQARARRALKRGGQVRISGIEEGILLTRMNDEHVLAVEDALQRLEEVCPQQARIVEMRFFGGLTVAQVAAELNVSKRWVEGEWTMIRAWLRAELTDVAET